jgi:hypothetical protein
MVRAMDDEFQAASIQWKECLTEEERIRGELRWQLNNGPRPSPDEFSEWERGPGLKPSRIQLQDWFKSIEAVWRMYSRQIASGYVPLPPPAMLAETMANLMGSIAVGELPDEIADAIGEGRSEYGPHLRRAIGWAVAYHRAAQGNGILHQGVVVYVKDKSPTKTVAEAFKVSRATVRKWVKKYPPAFLGVFAVTPDVVAIQMNHFAKIYRSAGRSEAAIRHRAKG